MKSVLVTGASGFIGRHTLPFLLEKGFEVHALSHSRSRPEQQGVTWHTLDLFDSKAMQNLVARIRPSHLLHTAWFAKPGEYWTSPLNIAWVKASLDLLTAFIENGGKRAIFSGTLAEYDWQYGCCKESLTPCEPATLYGTAKYTLYLLSQQMAKQANLSFAWGRVFFLFGEHEAAGRLFSSGITALLHNQNFVVTGGDKIRDFLYVQDAASALVALVNTEVSGPVNIASGLPLSIRDVMWAIGEKLHKTDHLRFQSSPSQEPPLLIADITRLREEVKWSPAYTLDQALDRTLRWWEKNL